MRNRVCVSCPSDEWEACIFLNGKKTEPIIDGSSGGYRLIAETEDGNLIKVDYCESDEEGENPAFTRQTWAEIRMYPHILKKDLRHFPALIDHGRYWDEHDQRMYSWLIQEKVHMVVKPKATAYHADVINYLTKRYGISDIGRAWAGMKLYNTSNWGVTLRGKPLIYDFGFNQFGVKQGEKFEDLFGDFKYHEKS